MKLWTLFFLFAGLANLSVGQNRLSDDLTFQETFTESQLADLQVLFDFFNESICTGKGVEKLNACYSEYFKKIEPSFNSNGDDLGISFAEQQDAFSSISDASFSAIWEFREAKMYNLRYSMDLVGVYNELCFRSGSNYLEFLEKTGKSYQEVEYYLDFILSENSIGPGSIALLALEYDKFKISDIRVKFIFAIHYLTLNDYFRKIDEIEK